MAFAGYFHNKKEREKKTWEGACHKPFISHIGLALVDRH